MDVVCLGEIILDMFPAEVGRPLAQVPAFRPVPGGAPANVAVACARLGTRSAFIGKVGDDAFGRHLVETLSREGVDTSGMRLSREATRQNISQIFALVEDGGITRFPGVVDFVQGGDMSGGVFVTVRVPDARIRQDLEYLKVGKGDYFTFFRPYHLWFLEAPISIARAFLRRETTLVPKDHPVADVMTVAKRALQPGDCLDQFGGFTFYGVIEGAATAVELRALPAGLASGAEVVRPVAAGGVIAWDDVRLDEKQAVVRLRRLQDGLPEGGAEKP